LSKVITKFTKYGSTIYIADLTTRCLLTNTTTVLQSVFVVSVYASQVRRTTVEKFKFLMSLREILSTVSVDEYLACCNMNGHVGAKIDGFDGIHEGIGYGV